MHKKTVFFQLWCNYELEDNWKMEGLFDSREEARDYLERLRDRVDTPNMPDWAIIEVIGWWK